jgi:uncharacterized RDD family membrane protein YckC
MDRSTHAAHRPVLHAPEGGLPGIPGSGGSEGSGGLPGIPGSGPLSGSGSGPTPQPAPPAFPAQPEESGSITPQATPSFSQPAPPQIPGVTYELASWGRRFAAWLVDGLIIIMLLIPFVAIASSIGLDTGTSTSGEGSFNFSAQDGQFLASFGLFLLVVLFYAPTTMVALKGATPGKALVGIRVVRAGGEPITFGFALLREWVLKGIVVWTANSFTLGLAGLLNYLWPLWDSENRALHDIAAKSRVVRR